jgi:hypothetical protein
MPIASQPSRPAANEPLVTIGRPDSRANFGDEGNRRAAQLRSMPPDRFTFDRASLRDVLRFLAESAGIPYIGLPEHSPEAQRLVTFRMTASPFAALESVARQNDIKLTFQDGVWFMGLRDANLERARKAEDQNELVGVIYQLRHDPVDTVDFKGTGQGGGGAGSSVGSSQDTINNGSGGSSGGAQAGNLSSPALPLQSSQLVFNRRAPRIVNDVRVMLGLRPLQYNADGSISADDGGGAMDAQLPRLPIPAYDGALRSAASAVEAQGQGASSGFAALVGGAPATGGPAQGSGGQNTSGDPGMYLPVYVPPQKPQVIYNSDSNVLWVVATRKQHRWVSEYLQRVDKPQDLIAIEVKFFETRKNPKTDFGINWANTFGTGLTIGGQASIGSADEPIGSLSFDRSRQSGTTNGTTVNTSSSASSVSGDIPYSAVLSLSQFSVTMQAFMEDRDSSLVQYPRVLTINNREVAITSAENTPVNSGVQNVSSGTTGGQNVGTLSYVPVGTQINILPKSVGKNQIALTVAVTISQIVDYVRINLGTGENAYPVTTQRVYNSVLQVDSGYTLAVGGLEKVADRNVTGGVPFLKDIPGFGYLFKNKNKARDKSNLIIFITPYLISDPAVTPGISEKPEAVVPIRPGVPPPAPRFNPDGMIVGGDKAVAEALSWLEFQLRYFRQTQIEGRTDANTVEQLRQVITVARSLDDYLSGQVAAESGYVHAPTMDQADQAKSLLLDLNRALAAATEDEAEQSWLP